jgi:phage terminase large subunit-like protein
VIAGWGGLPNGSHKWSAATWHDFHKASAASIGCTYEPEKVAFVRDIAAILRHTKGVMAGQPIVFLPWFLHRVVTPYFGYIDDATGMRRYNKCYIFVAKKNAKTTSMAPILAQQLIFDGERGAEIYTAAGDIDQAAIVYRQLSPMLREVPELEKMLIITDSQKHIALPRTHSWLKVLSAEVDTKHGINPHCVYFDELHGQPNRHLWETLTVGTFAAQVQPSLFTTSTAGYDINSICAEEWDYARLVRDGVIEDPTLLPVIYEVPKDADWTDPDTWFLANPSMGTREDMLKGHATISFEDMLTEFTRAKAEPRKENMFRRMRLNQWVSQESRWLPMHHWDSMPKDREPLRGRVHFAGLDLSTTTDLTSYVRVSFDGEMLDVYDHHFLPADGIEEKEDRDRVPYREWARQGFLTLTEGNVIDYPTVRAYINRMAAEDGKPEELAFDEWNATQLCQVELPSDGHTCVKMRQGFITLSAPSKRLEELVLSGRIRTVSPVLRWMAENVVVDTDPAGNIKPNKGKAKHRIDGIVALVMALDRASRHAQPKESVYAKRGIISL